MLFRHHLPIEVSFPSISLGHLSRPLYWLIAHPFEKLTACAFIALYWLHRTSVRERGPWAFTARLFFVVKRILAIEIAGKSFSWTRENRHVGAAAYQGRHAQTA